MDKKLNLLLDNNTKPKRQYNKSWNSQKEHSNHSDNECQTQTNLNQAKRTRRKSLIKEGAYAEVDPSDDDEEDDISSRNKDDLNERINNKIEEKPAKRDRKSHLTQQQQYEKQDSVSQQQEQTNCQPKLLINPLNESTPKTGKTITSNQVINNLDQQQLKKYEEAMKANPMLAQNFMNVIQQAMSNNQTNQAQQNNQILTNSHHNITNFWKY